MAASTIKAAPGQANEFKDIDITKKKRGMVKWVILLVILLLLAGSAVAIFVFNVFGIRENYVTTPLSNVPVVGSLINTEGLQLTQSLVTREELEYELNNYRTQLAQMETELAQANAMNINQVFEINRLLDIEAQQASFSAREAEFDRMIAEGDTRAFVQFYADINPERQEELYRELRGDLIIEDQMLELVRLYENMNTRAATEALESMIGPNTQLVMQILEGLSLSTRATIVQNMSNNNRVTITNLLAPQNQ